jgi:hypothetical protein
VVTRTLADLRTHAERELLAYFLSSADMKCSRSAAEAHTQSA